MSTWVYFLSKFTAEALLFETLVIFGLIASYAAFYVLRKRKFGSADDLVPAGVVKTYLNELIVDAEQMRAQLFGLLSAAGIQLSPEHKSALGTHSAHLVGHLVSDPALMQKIIILEAKMQEQSAAMDTMVTEKSRIESELYVAKSAKGQGGAESAGDNAELLRKIDALESKLAEYSVIEDDLANLKRLQQENAQLKSALSAGAQPTAAPVAPVAAAPVAPTVAASLAPVAAASAIAPTPEVAAETGDAPINFESLVDEVEKSLQKNAPQNPEASTTQSSAAPEPIAAIESPAQAGATSQPDTQGKSDADLLAEFEKMLNP